MKGVVQIIREIKEGLLASMKEIANLLDGSKLGEDVGNFYRKLIEGGLPEDMARQMTEKYFETRLNAIPNISSIINAIAKEISGKSGPKIVIEGGSSPEAVARQLEKLAETLEDEEKKKKLLKAAKIMRVMGTTVEEREEERKEKED